jgi:hypothetical protein
MAGDGVAHSEDYAESSDGVECFEESPGVSRGDGSEDAAGMGTSLLITADV